MVFSICYMISICGASCFGKTSGKVSFEYVSLSIDSFKLIQMPFNARQRRSSFEPRATTQSAPTKSSILNCKYLPMLLFIQITKLTLLTLWNVIRIYFSFGIAIIFQWASNRHGTSHFSNGFSLDLFEFLIIADLAYSGSENALAFHSFAAFAFACVITANGVD